MQAAPGGGPFQQPCERGRGLRGRVGLIKIIYIRERFAVQDVGGALRRGRVLREAVREAGVELRPVCSLGYRPAKAREAQDADGALRPRRYHRLMGRVCFQRQAL